MSTSLAKQTIMAGRKHKEHIVVPVNKSHEIYLAIQKYPGHTEAEYRKLLVHPDSSITSGDIYEALKRFTTQGHLNSKTGLGKGRPLVYEINDEKPYTPRAVMRKVAPNDRKAIRSLEGKATKTSTVKKAPDESTGQEVVAGKPVSLQLVTGLAVVDANNPSFAKEVREIAEKTGQIPDRLPVIEGPYKPIAMMEFTFAGDIVQVSLKEARRLYDELHEHFGK